VKQAGIEVTRYLWLAVVTQLVASTIPSASKLVLNSFPVEPYIALRWSISAIAFGVLLKVSKARCVWEPRLIAKVSALGLGGYVFASLGTLYAVKIGGVSLFGLLTLLSPLTVIAVSAIVFKERIRRTTWMAIGIAFIGLTAMVNGRVELLSARSAIAAAALVIAAYTADSLTFLYSKPFQAKLSLLQYLFAGQAAAAVSMWLVSFAMYPREQLLPPNREVWGAIVYVAFVSCVAVYFVWYWLLKHLQGQQLGILQYLHGMAAALWGMLIFDERLTRPMIVGSLFLLASIVIASRGAQRGEASPNAREFEAST
jgi:drug/metabolite transporter (DMT)-like permease